MNKKIVIVCFLAAAMLTISFTTVAEMSGVSTSNNLSEYGEIASEEETIHLDLQEPEYNQVTEFSDEYGVQWEMNFGSDGWYGARYEGPQPIGDCDNDGKNEFLIGGRDDVLRVMEWDEGRQTYVQTHALHWPLYSFDPSVSMDAGGFAIGDLTGDGKNEIAATWNAAVYKWSRGKYKIIGWNSLTFEDDRGSPDCYIGDYDNDGKNELITCGGPIWGSTTAPEIIVFGWNGLLGLVKEAEWKNPDSSIPHTYIYMAGMGDVDYDGENEIVCCSALKVIVLDWNKDTKEFESTIIDEADNFDSYPFSCVCKDSDNDGKDEILIGNHCRYDSPDIGKLTIFKWDGVGYEVKFEKEWPGEESVIEALDVGDVDDDGMPEVCVGTNLIHILQWDGSTYVEEAVLPTFGNLAVLNIGDCDNDGKNEIHAGSVFVEHGKDFMSWIFKYGWNSNPPSQNNQQLNICSQQHSSSVSNQYNGQTTTTTTTGSLQVTVKNTLLRALGGGCVAAWNLDTRVWYDIQPSGSEDGIYRRSKLPAGDYTLRAVVDGYKTQETTITIVDGQETSHTFSLKAASLETSKNKDNNNNDDSTRQSVISLVQRVYRGSNDESSNTQQFSSLFTQVLQSIFGRSASNTQTSTTTTTPMFPIIGELLLRLR